MNDYLERVMAEIDEEVRARRASGDLPYRIERELDELFLEHSPMMGRSGQLEDLLRMVESAAFIDPVAPVESQRSGGAVIKKSLRTVLLWYMGYVTAQVSQFTSATARALRVLDQSQAELAQQLEAERVPAVPAVDLPELHRADAWWVKEVVASLGGRAGRVLHAAAGYGWLVRHLAEESIDAYGVEPRPGRLDEAALTGYDLREGDLCGHLRATGPGSLGGIVLSGVVEPMTAGLRGQVLDLAADRLVPGAPLVIHSLTPQAWAADDAPVEADLAAGRPLRPATWVSVLDGAGFEATVRLGPSGSDYLVVAECRGVG